MKIISFITVILLFTLSASASYVQTYCSNAEGNIRWASGHKGNSAHVVRQTWDETGYKETVFSVYNDFPQATLSLKIEITLKEWSKKTCSESGGGTLFWSNVTYGNLTMTNSDGSEFPDGILGLSEDKKSITNLVLCEKNGNSRILCESHQ